MAPPSQSEQATGETGQEDQIDQKKLEDLILDLFSSSDTPSVLTYDGVLTRIGAKVPSADPAMVKQAFYSLLANREIEFRKHLSFGTKKPIYGRLY